MSVNSEDSDYSDAGDDGGITVKTVVMHVYSDDDDDSDRRSKK